MRDWVVGGALIERDGDLLLVRNRRRDGRQDWTPPGGVIDPGESVLGGLEREVEEETGLVVVEWAGPVYEVHAEAPDLGWRLRAEIHLAREVQGSIHVADPDGIVTDARYVDSGTCEECLGSGSRWVREPLLDWIDERWSSSRDYRYLVEGADLRSLSVSRV